MGRGCLRSLHHIFLCILFEQNLVFRTHTGTQMLIKYFEILKCEIITDKGAELRQYFGVPEQ